MAGWMREHVTGLMAKEVAAQRAPDLKPRDERKTYLYLRIGMIGAVVLLTTSIVIERSKVDCWQTSISAYYYTPVRAIFVGSMIVVGFSLIVYKGRGSLEDICLNIAGMLAPVVAVAPTTDVGKCWSVAPNPLPVLANGSVASWVLTNIDNNFNALLIAGGTGLLVAIIFAIRAKRSVVRAALEYERGTTVSLAITAVGLISGWLLIQHWDAFYKRAHGFAAVAMFVFLACAVIIKAVGHWKQPARKWFLSYTAVAACMILGGVFIWTTRIFDEHTVFALEAWEIFLFASYWIAQTAEYWDEDVKSICAPPAAQAGGG